MELQYLLMNQDLRESTIGRFKGQEIRVWGFVLDCMYKILEKRCRFGGTDGGVGPSRTPQGRQQDGSGPVCV